MNLVAIFAILSAVSTVVHTAQQQQFELQFIGSEITKEEQSNLDFCETKYCLLDANYIFLDATQNKSVKPCEDFKEFAVGTFIKHKALSERKIKVSFFGDVDELWRRRIRRALVEKVNENDSKITTAMKKLFTKCVNSDYIRRHGPNEMRQYLKKFGLKFYPDSDQDDFVLKDYIEQQPIYAIDNLFRHKLSRDDEYVSLKKVKSTGHTSNLRYFGAYTELLYEMFQVYRNSSVNAKIYLEEFEKISRKQLEFYELQTTFISKKKGAYMTIDKMNALTSSLNLDWSKIFTNAFHTNLRGDELIWIEQPQTIKNLANFLALADKKLVADFLTYDFIFRRRELVEVYLNEKYTMWKKGTKKSRERWYLCADMFKTHLNPAMSYAFWLKFKDEMPPEPVEKFVNEAKEFLVKKIKAEAKWEEAINNELIERVRAIKVINGYPEEYLKPKKIDELYSNLQLDVEDSFVGNMLEMISYNEKILLEPPQSEIRKLFDLTVYFTHALVYSPYTDLLYIHFEYLLYPFYQYQRTRFFNSATLGYFFFDEVERELSRYLWKKYSLWSLDLLSDRIQVAYEFYDDWLESGEKDSQLGAHRLTDRQLFWMAMAKVWYQKYDHSKTEKNPVAKERSDYEYMHRIFFKKKGFREAFQCKVLFGDN